MNHFRLFCKMVILFTFTHQTLGSMVTQKIDIDAKTSIEVELALNDEERAHGLMERSELKQNTGMLFVFPIASNWSFWMKNTLISLDIIWLDQKKTIVYFLDNVQPCYTPNCPMFTPPKRIEAQYVLEIGAGERRRLNLTLGQRLHF